MYNGVNSVQEWHFFPEWENLPLWKLSRKTMIKIGLLGIGHLGTIHLRLIKELSDVYELTGIYDVDPANAKAKAEEFDTISWEDPEELIEASDAIDIVTPTLSHFEFAKAAMKRFKHVFIEKPVTTTVEEAKKLIDLEREAGVKVQVGHVERYNPAFLAVRDRDLRPMFVECHRLAQWNPRGTDVSVVQDLMIHDLDIVLKCIKSDIKRISASGVAIVSDSPDIANARIEFNNGAVANLTASRISLKNMRKTRLFQHNAYYAIDFLSKKTEIINIHEGMAPKELGEMAVNFKAGDREKYLSFENPPSEPVNSIKLELEDFAMAIQNNTNTGVTLTEATAALIAAHQIMDKINNFITA